MNRASFRFYADLAYFLRHEAAGQVQHYDFHGSPAIKDAIEALGVPHPEVELILVNGQRAGFEYRLQPGDRVGVFPAFRSLSLPEGYALRPPLPDTPRFVLDIHLGRLAAYLRLLGFNVLYNNDSGDAQLADMASRQGRVLLTRDRGLLKRSEVRYGYCLRSSQPREQTLEVLRRYELGGSMRPFTRCMRCNGLLEEVPKAAVLDRLPASVRIERQEFRRCRSCGRVYWRGSHYARLLAFIAGLQAAPGVRG